MSDQRRIKGSQRRQTYIQRAQSGDSPLQLIGIQAQTQYADQLPVHAHRHLREDHRSRCRKAR
ncbi:hypothetical protein D3C84_1034900 [compost metagenome]